MKKHFGLIYIMKLAVSLSFALYFAASLLVGCRATNQVQTSNPPAIQRIAKSSPPQVAEVNTTTDNAGTGLKDVPATTSSTQTVSKNVGSSESNMKRFEERSDTNSVTLKESGGERLELSGRLDLKIGMNGKSTGKQPSFDIVAWKARECTYTAVLEEARTLNGVQPDGSLWIKEVSNISGRYCRRPCKLELNPGWGTYRRICDNRVYSTGRFDSGLNLSNFQPWINLKEFFEDPNASAIAAKIPKPAYRLEHEDAAYKKRVATLPAVALSAAKSGFRKVNILDFDLLDAVEAILIANRGNLPAGTGYISGSARNLIKEPLKDGSFKLRATITAIPSLGSMGAWSEAAAYVTVENGKPICVSYSFYSQCSVDYDRLVRDAKKPTIDMSSCIRINSRTRTTTIPGYCEELDAFGVKCKREGPPREQKESYAVLENICASAQEVVTVCAFTGKRIITIPANAVIERPGFIAEGCGIETR